MPEAPVWVTTSDFAQRLSIAPKTVRRWIHEGRIPADAWFQANHQIRVHVEKAEAALFAASAKK